MTELQNHAVLNLLRVHAPTEFGHGDCVGADAQAAEMAYGLGIRIMCFPPVHDGNRAFTSFNHETFPAETYFARNRRIVSWCDLLIGCPPTMERLVNGGTWYTLDYAKRIKRQTRVCWPNGAVTVEGETVFMDFNLTSSNP